MENSVEGSESFLSRIMFYQTDNYQVFTSDQFFLTIMKTCRIFTKNNSTYASRKMY